MVLQYNNFFQEFKERVGASLGTVRDLLAAVPVRLHFSCFSENRYIHWVEP